MRIGVVSWINKPASNGDAGMEKHMSGGSITIGKNNPRLYLIKPTGLDRSF